MDVCSLDEIQDLFIQYAVCFSGYFPELGFECNEKGFQVHGVIRRYKDITGVSYDASHFLVEIRREYVIGLPLLADAKFRILVKRSTLSS